MKQSMKLCNYPEYSVVESMKKKHVSTWFFLYVRITVGQRSKTPEGSQTYVSHALRF